MGMTTCPDCGEGFTVPAGATGTCPCPKCGLEIAVDFLSLELPPAGAVASPRRVAPPRPAARPEAKAPARTAPVRKEETPVVVANGHDGWIVKFPASAKLTLPGKCACCLGEPGDSDVVGAKAGFPVGVPYCAECVRHQRRVPLRRAVQAVVFVALWAIYFGVLEPGPGAGWSFLGIAAAVLVASGAAGCLLVPRFRTGTRHGREGAAAWFLRLEAGGVSLGFGNKKYARQASAYAGAGSVPPEKRRQAWGWLWGKLYGSQAEGARFPALLIVRPALAFGLMAVLIGALAPASAEEQAYRKFKAASNLPSAYEFARRYRHSHHVREMEDWAWDQVQNAPDLLRSFLVHFPGSHRRTEAERRKKALELAEARAEEERKAQTLRASQENAMATVRRERTVASAAAFLRAHPEAPQALEAREIIRSAILMAGDLPVQAPPPAVLERLFKSAPSGKVNVSVTGFKDAGYGDKARQRLQEALSDLGLTAEFTDGEALIRVEGENGLDKNYSYSKFAFAGSTGPYAEYARATILVQFRPAERPAWSTRVSASSPQRIKYTTYSFGGGTALDTGPSQYHVREQTLPEFASALAPVFKYR